MNKSWYNFSLPSVQKGNADVNIKYTENRTGSSTLVLNDYMFRLKTEKKGENSYWYCVKPTYHTRKNLIQDIPTKLSYFFV